MKELVYVNPNKKDNCDISKLNPEWKTILSNYMSSRYITCNTYEIRNSYFIATDDVDDDTINIINRAKVTIYSIDYIVDSILSYGNSHCFSRTTININDIVGIQFQK